jgi:hypothetical protein
MAHFAEIDENNVVKRVLVVNDDYLKDENGNEVEELGKSHMMSVYGGRWVQTSYNNSIRVRYAGIGFIYDETLDAFVRPKPYDSWILNQDTADWYPPTPIPENELGVEQYYRWNESILDWEIYPPVPMPDDAPEGSYYQWNEETANWELIILEV